MNLDFRDLLMLDGEEYMVSNKTILDDREYYYLCQKDSSKIKIVYRINDEMFDVTDPSEPKVVMEKMCLNAKIILNEEKGQN